MADVKHFDPDRALGAVVELFWSRGVDAAGLRDIEAATGLARSSVYNAFGDKRRLYLAALDRYLDQRALPSFARLAQASDLADIREFFARLITDRCTGAHRGWGCLIVNGHLGEYSGDPQVQQRLNRHADALREAFHAALQRICSRAPHTSVAAAGSSGTALAAQAGMLATLAYGITMRSRAGAEAAELRAQVDSALAGCCLSA